MNTTQLPSGLIADIEAGACERCSGKSVTERMTREVFSREMTKMLEKPVGKHPLRHQAGTRRRRLP